MGKKIKIAGVTVDIGISESTVKAWDSEFKYVNQYIKRQVKSGKLFEGPVDNRKGWAVGRGSVSEDKLVNSQGPVSGTGLTTLAKHATVSAKTSTGRQTERHFTVYQTLEQAVRDAVKLQKRRGRTLTPSDIQTIAQETAKQYKQQVTEFHQTYGVQKDAKTIKRADERLTKRTERNKNKAAGRAIGKSSMTMTSEDWKLFKELQQKYLDLNSKDTFGLIYEIKRRKKEKKLADILRENGRRIDEETDAAFLDTLLDYTQGKAGAKL